jgi:hypothetical protein
MLRSSIFLNRVKNPTITTEVEQELESAAHGLGFELNCHLDILAPTTALEPICLGGRERSDLVLDTVREFSRSTAFSVYIEARDAPPTHQSISDAISQRLFKSHHNSRFHLTSMYAGLEQILFDSMQIIHLYHHPTKRPNPHHRRRRSTTSLTENATDKIPKPNALTILP